jgi:hypothetical protein
MTFITSQPRILSHEAHKDSLPLRFIQWATGEEEQHHIAWVGISILCMTAVFFPLSMSVILLNGAAFGLIITAMISLVLVFITNVASLPTRYTIPVFFLGILIDAGAIIASFVIRS